ncbi:winged helix-turn-helix domain-containing protein [Candidatus Nitrosotenuis chungbukensis]|uniref:winged helix-turn-helix domain-containing protein n=2 Tax=Candidatus Nitrosotenuis chungbukensis TaxID=1353246 RepID=UPI0005B28E00|nr:winged helix-turn-helix domain-containing protein [Candidatus Nitrosotenuis chungbukensis]WKT57423.1 winged helix-turn-helix domain-containing protein [Candidatus Nitrosotenuis chungbukensis]
MSASLNTFTHDKLVMIRKQTNIKNKKLALDFKPSMTALSRIMQTMIENGSECKTKLSLDANLNYARLVRHIVWLEKKGLVESKVEDNKINVVLTENGKTFASTISGISQ